MYQFWRNCVFQKLSLKFLEAEHGSEAGFENTIRVLLLGEKLPSLEQAEKLCMLQSETRGNNLDH